MGVTDAQAEQHPVPAAVVEAFGAGEQQLADPVERIVLAASMPKGLVLHPAADLVDAAVPDPDHMKRVGDPAGVVEVRRQPGPERLGQIGGHHLDPGQPAGSALLVHRRRSAALLPSTMSITTCRCRSTSPVA